MGGDYLIEHEERNAERLETEFLKEHNKVVADDDLKFDFHLWLQENNLECEFGDFVHEDYVNSGVCW